ncbi:co-chaperone GroES [Haliovirga abyssi]|uniref:Co-chaperonin GroES n=1 Tax=Haliovirga abyssi TaxID=2996794 RepID=A0AAU9D2L0_9FUSO|nr:co-chaperone GroES [Haliovirga abyssi]BDU50239.1 10 kDa chaperonin [Haliovirga abyssi]
MKIKPLGDRVLVKSVEVEVKTKSGIVLPDTVSKEKPTLGELVAVGDGKLASELNVGQKVIFAKYSGTEIKDNDEKYLILNYNDLLAIVED